MDALKVLILNYLAILAINLGLSTLMWFRQREQIYEAAVLFWGATALNVGLQGALDQTPLAMSLALASGILVVGAELRLIGVATGLTFPLKRYFAVHVLATASAVVIAQFTDRLLWVSLPVALSLAILMLLGAYKCLQGASLTLDRAGVRLFAMILCLHAAHMLDYPFLRDVTAFAPYGFSIALVFLVAMSIFVPAFLLRSTSAQYLRNLTGLTDRLSQTQRQLGSLSPLAQVGEMSYGFVHDMAGPITLLNLYLSQLSLLPEGDGTQSPNLARFSKGIEGAAKQLTKLQKLFGKFVQDPHSASVEDVPLKTALADCVELFAPLARKEGLEISSSVETREASWKAPSGLFERIIVNLVQNAINALVLSQKAEKKVRILISNAANGALQIVVSDSGPGIPKERAAALWERFGASETRNADKSRPRGVSGGSGFGLYNIRQMVVDAGGSITLAKTGPEGTTFEVLLPSRV